ncbi:hypothetical protein C8R43DRAFT_883481, partial [Mycena crocata]
MASELRAIYAAAIQKQKDSYWISWLESLDVSSIWTVSKFVGREASDGGAARMPTLEKCNGGVAEVAETNEEKAAMLRREFFPPKMVVSAVPSNPVYPPPAWKWEPVSDGLLHRSIRRMKPYKATYPGSTPNCVFTNNANVLVPLLGPIYRSIDTLAYYPKTWSDVQSLVLRKPGKTNYADPAAYRPIVLVKGLSRLLNLAKTLQCSEEAELAGILPSNHYG